MTIYFNSEWDGGPWSEGTTALGTIRTGPLGLLSILESRCGTSGRRLSHALRIAGMGFWKRASPAEISVTRTTRRLERCCVSVAQHRHLRTRSVGTSVPSFVAFLPENRGPGDYPGCFTRMRYATILPTLVPVLIISAGN
jgi:hypothetical protein